MLVNIWLIIIIIIINYHYNYRNLKAVNKWLWNQYGNLLAHIYVYMCVWYVYSCLYFFLSQFYFPTKI